MKKIKLLTTFLLILQSISLIAQDNPTVFDRGLLNDSRKIVVEPKYTSGIVVGNEKTVIVNIVIDKKGNVIKAEADNDITIKTLSIEAALKTKFVPYLANGKAIVTKGYLSYGYSKNFDDDYSIDTSSTIVKYIADELKKEMKDFKWLDDTISKSNLQKKSITNLEFKRDKVNITDNKSIIVNNIKDYLDEQAIAEIVKQVGQEKYNLIIKQIDEKKLPLCIQNCIKNKCHYNMYGRYASYRIAGYETKEYDDFLNKITNRYSIVEITPDENKKMADSCAVTSTFYIRIDNHDFMYDDSQTPIGRGDRIIRLIKNFMPSNKEYAEYNDALQKALALNNTNATSNEICKTYSDFKKASDKYDFAFSEINKIYAEGEVKFKTQEIANGVTSFIKFHNETYMPNKQFITNILLKYSCK